MINTVRNRNKIIIYLILLIGSIFAFNFYLYNRVTNAESFTTVEHLYSEKVPTPESVYTKLIDSEVIPFYVHTYVHSREQVRKIDSEDIKSWVEVNKGNVEFKRFFWDTEDVRNLIKCHLPEYVSMAHSLSNLCMSDLARYTILYLYGGIYVDTDVKILKPLSDLFNFVYNNTAKDTVIMGSEPVAHIKYHYSTIGDTSAYRGIPGSTVMIAKSKNPFFMHALNKILEKYESHKRNKQIFPPAWMFTGPLLLREIAIELSDRGKFVFTNDLKTTGYSTDEKINCKILPAETFYPEIFGLGAATMSNKGIPIDIVDHVKQWFEKYSSTGQYTNDTYLVHHWWSEQEKVASKYVPLSTIISPSDINALNLECN